MGKRVVEVGWRGLWARQKCEDVFVLVLRWMGDIVQYSSSGCVWRMVYGISASQTQSVQIPQSTNQSMVD